MAKDVDTSQTNKEADALSAAGKALFPPLTDHDLVLRRGGEKVAKPRGRYLDLLSSAERKRYPMAEGLMDYFPDALAMIALVSWCGNEKHNPGEPMHHARGKSTDHDNCVIRHFASRDDYDEYEINGEIIRVPHWAQAAWRILAYGQAKMEELYNLSLPRGAREYDVSSD